MNIIAKQNQYESYQNIRKERKSLYTEILEILEKEEKLIAREIANKIGRSTRQDVQPRLTELVTLGYIEEAEKMYDSQTRRNVTSYKLKNNKTIHKRKYNNSNH